MSPLFLFGRQQDVAYQQEVAGNPAKRHHVRFWRMPRRLVAARRSPRRLARRRHVRPGRGLLAVHAAGHAQDRRRHRRRARPHRRDRARGGSGHARVDVLEDFATGYHSRNGGGDSIRHRRRPAGDRRARDAGGRRRVRRGSRSHDRRREARGVRAAGRARGPVAGPPTMQRPVSTTVGLGPRAAAGARGRGLAHRPLVAVGRRLHARVRRGGRGPHGRGVRGDVAGRSTSSCPS